MCGRGSVDRGFDLGNGVVIRELMGFLSHKIPSKCLIIEIDIDLDTFAKASASWIGF